jgi:CHAD domain-containing protein
MSSESSHDIRSGGEPESRQEIEWQLAAPDLDRVRVWLSDQGSVNGLAIEARPTLKIDDTYLDTEDGRLRRAGFALRLRGCTGLTEATLKDLSPPVEGIRARREFNEPLPSADPGSLSVANGPVSTRVRAVTGPEPLQTLFHVRTRRECFAALASDGREAAEIALDDTIVAAASGESTTRLNRVEVEAISDTPESLAGLVDQLSNECALTPATDSKYDIGLQVAGIAQLAVPNLGSETIEPVLSAAEVARANLRRRLAAWIQHEPAARLGEDPEELHALRVAGRRIETTLRVFEPWLPAVLIRQRPAWKSLVRALGSVRDLDVQLAGLDSFAAELPARDAALLDPVRERLTTERRRARTRMLRALDRRATPRMVQRMRQVLARTQTRRSGAGAPAAAVAAPALIRRNFKKVRRAARDLHGDGSAAAHHALRRRAKRLRYTIEAFDGLYGIEAQKLVRAIRRLERTLGSAQDAHVAADRFRATVASQRRSVPPATAFLMGVIAERHCATATDVERRVAKRYARLHGRRWKAMQCAMDSLSSAYAEPGEADLRAQVDG